MNKTIHIFYNGFDYKCPLPQDDKWINYTNSTSPRMFLQTAASWMAKGWHVKRISSANVELGYKFNGRLRDSLERYPYPYWNLWRLLLTLRDFDSRMWICNMDCYNQDYTPEQAQNDLNGEVPTFKAVSLHVNRWSNAIMNVTPEFVLAVNDAIELYDEGRIDPLPNCDFVHDENLIRETLQDYYVTVPRCDFGFIKAHWEKAPLINISRSTITRAMATIPVVW